MKPGTSALAEAQRHKRELEELITRQVEEFHKTTGLFVVELSMEVVDITPMGHGRQAHYQVYAKIEV